jgi:Ser/Thr protein kinase RdoA (MazF antagonist)
VLDGQSVLVTEFVAGVPRSERPETIRNAGGLAALGWLLGRLHTLPSAPALARAGGAWHHLADGSPADEIAALADLLAASAPRAGSPGAAGYRRLQEEVAGLDGASGLPESFVHPDFVLANVVATPENRLVLVDWTGAGRAPRAWSLAFLLWSVGYGGDLGRVDRTVAGYRRHVAPEPEELERLEALIRVRPTVFDAWAFCTGRKTLEQVTAGIAASRETAAAIAVRARAAFAAK